MRRLPIRNGLFFLSLAALATIGSVAVACSDDDTTTATTTTPAAGESSPAAGIPADVGKNDSASLTGSGSSFVQDVYTTWASLYQKVAKNVTVNYTGGG